MNKLRTQLLSAMQFRAAALRCALTASERPLGPTLLIFGLFVAASGAMAQTTAFTYQGRLNDNGNPASGNYDFQFKLFDTATVGTGTQFGSTASVPTVQVTAGIFTVQLDFGVSVFPGAARFLEIAVKQTSGSAFTTLGPRQPVTSNPYAIRSLAATAADGLSVACVGCITSGQIQTVQGSQVTGDIAGNQISGTIPVASVPPGSNNYVQNTNTPQASVNFNIGGTGTANVLDATTQFNLGGNRILSNTGTLNLFAGIGAGAVNTGSNNSFFGENAGTNNSTGSGNAFFGESAGTTNTQGNANSFFGFNAGIINTGFSNSFFGNRAGVTNTGGFNNAFFGWEAGRDNSMGAGNSFFGIDAGEFNTTGSSNSFVGSSSGFITGPGTGDKNTTLGADATVNSGLSNATAIGAGAYAIQNNTLVLGSINGSGRGTADTNVGIGINNPLARLHIKEGSGNILMGSTGCGAGLARIDFAFSASCTSYAMLGGDGNTHINRPSGGAIFFREGNFTQMTIKSGGIVAIEVLGAAGTPQSTLCRNAAHEIAVCSSSLRYKTNLASYRNGLDVINRLKPITFTWKEGGMRDIGLGAEDVEKVEPLLTFRNDKGEIEGVKYSQLSAVFVNAFKQQQSQIKQRERQATRQQKQIEQDRKQLAEQQSEIESLKRIVCLDHPTATICKARRKAK